MNTKALRQKILDLAIHGKLLSHETVAELKNSPDYETADVLLEKIRKEKEEKIAKGELKRDKKDSFIFVGSNKRHYEQFADGTVKDIEDEIPFELPEGWAWTSGNEIFLPMTSKKPNGKTFRYIDIDSIDNKNHKVKNPKELEVSKAPSRASRELKSGDILFALVRPYLENIAFIDEKNSNCIASTGFYICRPNNELFPKYAFYMMTSDYAIKGLNQFMKGDNSPSISGNDIQKWLYPLPPLAEQKLIVAKIEQIFEQIDYLEQNKSDLQTAVKQAKSKILDLAIHGKLVQQDPNDEPAEELLKRIATSDNRPYEKILEESNPSTCEAGVSSLQTSHLPQHAFMSVQKNEAPFELPEGWAWCRLEEITSIISKGTTPRGGKSAYCTTGINYLRVENIRDNGTIDLHNICHITESEHIGFLKRSILQENDLIISIAGTLGKTAIIRKCDLPMNTNQAIAFVRIADLSILNLQYLRFILKSSEIQQILLNQTKVTSIPNLTLEIIGKCPIPLPSIQEQLRIVEKINVLYKQLDEIVLNLV